VTVLFSRSQWAIHQRCQLPAGAITLRQVADYLDARGWRGTSSAVTSQIGTTALKCTASALYPTWAMLRDLKNEYGWQLTSHSATHRNMTELTPTQQRAESCGTLRTFMDQGFRRAWGLFSYPNNKRSLTIQTDIVSDCFAFGRRYSPDRNKAATMRAPWWANVRPVNGGACNEPGTPCYSIDTRFRYADPNAMGNLLAVSPGQWAIVQFHKLVSGAKLSGRSTWDCRSSDWRLHFTNRTEVYCWNDYRKILSRIPSGAVVTDPAKVARSWGANPQVLQRHD
jgi:hypothetical protein